MDDRFHATMLYHAASPHHSGPPQPIRLSPVPIHGRALQTVRPSISHACMRACMFPLYPSHGIRARLASPRALSPPLIVHYHACGGVSFRRLNFEASICLSVYLLRASTCLFVPLRSAEYTMSLEGSWLCFGSPEFTPRPRRGSSTGRARTYCALE